MTNNRDLVAAYAQWTTELVERGFEPHFVTFMFNPLPGSAAARWQQMQREIDRVYGRVLMHTFREPNAAKNQPWRPVLIAAPDFPIFKHDRDRLADIRVNDGQHAHGAWLMPPRSHRRMPENLSGHLMNYGHRYAGAGRGLQRINSEPITHDLEYMVSYAFKAVGNGRADLDSFAVWPKSRTEMK